MSELAINGAPDEAVTPQSLGTGAARMLASTTKTPPQMQEILTDPQRTPAVSEALFERVFSERGGTFTSTIMRHYAERGLISADRITPVVMDIGEALTTKYFIDMGAPPDDSYLAEIVDQAILPALGWDAESA